MTKTSEGGARRAEGRRPGQERKREDGLIALGRRADRPAEYVKEMPIIVHCPKRTVNYVVRWAFLATLIMALEPFPLLVDIQHSWGVQ